MKHLHNIDKISLKKKFEENVDCSDVMDMLYDFKDDGYNVSIENKIISIDKSGENIDLNNFASNFKSFIDSLSSIYTVVSNEFNVTNSSAYLNIKYMDEVYDNEVRSISNYLQLLTQLRNNVPFQNLYVWDVDAIEIQMSMAFHIVGDKKNLNKFKVWFNTNYFDDKKVKEFREFLNKGISYDCNFENYKLILEVTKYLNVLYGDR